MLTKDNRRIAEIYRRSEIILQKRKKRRKCVLFAGVPIVLCAVVIIANVMLFRFYEPKNTLGVIGSDHPQETIAADHSQVPQAAQKKLLSVRVQGPETEICLNESEALTRFMQALEGITDASNQGGSNDSFSLGISGTEKLTYDPNTDYLIALTDNEGKTVEYVIKESVLFNAKTQEKYTLTDSDIAVLSEIMQITLK